MLGFSTNFSYVQLYMTLHRYKLPYCILLQLPNLVCRPSLFLFVVYAISLWLYFTETSLNSIHVLAVFSSHNNDLNKKSEHHDARGVLEDSPAHWLEFPSCLSRLQRSGEPKTKGTTARHCSRAVDHNPDTFLGIW